MTETVTASPRQTRRYEQKREAILAAAAGLFNQKGVKGATLADVAQGVGLITNSITYYYRRKEDLATACFLRTIETFNDLISAAETAPTPEARLHRFLDLYFRMLAEMALRRRPELVSFSDVRALVGPHAEVVFSTYTDMFRRVRKLFSTEPGYGLGRAEQNARTHLLVSLVHGARLWVGRYEPEDYGRAAERMGDILVRGLAGRQSAWAPTPAGTTRPVAGTAIPPEAFLRAATELINEQGYRGASVEKISARLNVTKGSFYHHNDNKDELVADCFSRTFAVIREAQQAASAAHGSGWHRLCAAAGTLVRYQLSDHGPLLRSSALSALPEALRHDMLATANRLSERFASFIVDGIADGSIRPVDPSIAAQMVNTMINAAAELRRWVPGVTIETAVPLYARPLLTGLFTPGTAFTTDHPAVAE